MKDFVNIDFQYRKLIRVIKNLEDSNKMMLAIQMAKKAHCGQKRDEGQDYLVHPLRVANCLIYEKSILDSDLIISAILHDVIEDSNFSLKQIQETFGGRVAELVDKLTRDKLKETKLFKLKKTLNQSNEVRLLKSLDWLDNSRSLLHRNDRESRYKRHIIEVGSFYIVLAQSIDSDIANEMQDIIKKIAAAF